MNNDDYPVQLSIDYGDGSRSRLTTLFRIILIIPIAIVAGFLAGVCRSCLSTVYYGIDDFCDPIQKVASRSARWDLVRLCRAGITIGIVLLILFRKKYPRWVFDFIVEVARSTTRVGSVR